jgi:hypothetical protein
MSVFISFPNGWTYSAQNPADVVQMLRSQDWISYDSVWDFKNEVQNRCSVLGVSFVCWDATSFLMGLMAAGICSVDFDYTITQERKK